MTHETIPIIDLAAPVDLDTVKHATRTLGAIQVINHGIEPALQTSFNERMARLLSQPRDRKAQLASPHPYRGWRQWPDDFGRLELERFNVAQFDNDDDARRAGLSSQHAELFTYPNLWPDQETRATTFDYMEATTALATRMLKLYATAHNIPGFNIGATPHVRLTVNDYPTWSYDAAAKDEDKDEDEDEDKLLLLEHADDSAVTILAQQGDYEGLQIQSKSGNWLPVPVIPGALQVFSGSLLARWTGDELRPAKHRVVAGGRDTRRSVALFFYPSLEEVVAPMPQFGGGGAPIAVWEHVKDRVRDYLGEYGRPDQVSAWQQGTPYVAPLAKDSAGR